MKKFIIGFIVGASLLAGVNVIAGYIQDLASEQKVYNSNNISVSRFEWYSDVCYVAQSNGTFSAAISCLKK